MVIGRFAHHSLCYSLALDLLSLPNPLISLHYFSYNGYLMSETEKENYDRAYRLAVKGIYLKDRDIPINSVSFIIHLIETSSDRLTYSIGTTFYRSFEYQRLKTCFSLGSLVSMLGL